MPTADLIKQYIPFQFKPEDFKEDRVSGNTYGYFEGYGSCFNNVDHGGDMVVRGAFKSSIESGRKVKLFWQHNSHEPIGSFVELREDDIGLFCKGRINLGTEKGRDAYALLRAGDIDGLSIGYSVVDAEIDPEAKIRVLKQVNLFEISLVSFPMNPKAVTTDVKQLKNEIDNAESLADIEKVLKKGGFTQKQIRAIVSKVKKFSTQCDVAAEKTPEPQCDVGGDETQKAVLQELKNLTNLIRGKTNG